MSKKRKLILGPDAIPQSLLQQLEVIRTTKTRAESLDDLVHVAVWLYVDLVDRLNLGMNGKLVPILPEFSNSGPPPRPTSHRESEEQGKFLSLVPCLDPEDTPPAKT